LTNAASNTANGRMSYMHRTTDIDRSTSITGQVGRPDDARSDARAKELGHVARVVAAKDTFDTRFGIDESVEISADQKLFRHRPVAAVQGELCAGTKKRGSA
jgi:hypothetical protein